MITDASLSHLQPLDNKVIKQLETAISKSQYVGQGKKLKVVSKVRTIRLPIQTQSRMAELTLTTTGQP